MKPTHALREHHDRLVRNVLDLEQVLDSLPRVSAVNLSEVVARQVAFLQNEIKKHAAADEASLYPEVDFLANAHGCKISDTIKIDNEYIGTCIDRLAELAEELTPVRVPEFQRLGWELTAILKLQFAKEERVFLPLLDAGYTEEEVARRIVKRMEQIEVRLNIMGKAADVGYDYA